MFSHESHASLWVLIIFYKEFKECHNYRLQSLRLAIFPIFVPSIHPLFLKEAFHQ